MIVTATRNVISLLGCLVIFGVGLLLTDTVYACSCTYHVVDSCAADGSGNCSESGGHSASVDGNDVSCPVGFSGAGCGVDVPSTQRRCEWRNSPIPGNPDVCVPILDSGYYSICGCSPGGGPTNTPVPLPTNTPIPGCIPDGSCSDNGNCGNTCTTDACGWDNCNNACRWGTQNCGPVPTPAPVPGVPTGLDYTSSCVGNAGTANLTWDAMSGATYYVLQVSERRPSGGPWNPCNNPPNSTYDV